MRAHVCKIGINAVSKNGQLSLNHFHFFPYQGLTNPPRNAFFSILRKKIRLVRSDKDKKTLNRQRKSRSARSLLRLLSVQISIRPA